MKTPETRDIIKRLEEGSDAHQAIVSFLEWDTSSYFIRANPDGLRLLAKELLRASVDEPSEHGRVFIRDGSADEIYSEIRIAYVERLEVNKPDIRTESGKGHSGRDKFSTAFLVRFSAVILSLFAFSMFLLGLVTFIRWLF